MLALACACAARHAITFDGRSGRLVVPVASGGPVDDGFSRVGLRRAQVVTSGDVRTLFLLHSHGAGCYTHTCFKQVAATNALVWRRHTVCTIYIGVRELAVHLPAFDIGELARVGWVLAFSTSACLIANMIRLSTMHRHVRFAPPDGPGAHDARVPVAGRDIVTCMHADVHLAAAWVYLV